MRAKISLALFILANCQVDLFPFTVEYSTGNLYVCVCFYMCAHDMHIIFDKLIMLSLEKIKIQLQQTVCGGRWLF